MDYLNHWITNPGLQHLALKIFMYLDLKSVVQSRKVCQFWFKSQLILNLEIGLTIQNCGRVPLHLACRSYEALEYVLQNAKTYGIDFNTKDYTGNTLLHNACKHRNLRIVQLILNYSIKRNINLNPINKKFQTPLLLAYLASDLDICRAILDFANQFGIIVDCGYNSVGIWRSSISNEYTLKLLVDTNIDFE